MHAGVRFTVQGNKGRLDDTALSKVVIAVSSTMISLRYLSYLSEWTGEYTWRADKNLMLENLNQSNYMFADWDVKFSQ